MIRVSDCGCLYTCRSHANLAVQRRRDKGVSVLVQCDGLNTPQWAQVDRQVEERNKMDISGICYICCIMERSGQDKSDD